MRLNPIGAMRDFMFKWDTTVFIKEVRKDGVRWRKFTGKNRTRIDAEDYFLIKDYYAPVKHAKTRVVPFKYIQRIAGRDYVYFYSPQPDVFIPMEFIDGQVVPVDQDAKFFLGMAHRMANLKYSAQSFFEKYWPIIGLAIVGIVLMMIIYVVFKNWVDVAEQNRAILVQANNLLSQIHAMQCGTPVAPATPPV